MTEILIFISSNFAFEIYSKHGNIRVRVKEKTITKGDLHTAQWKIRCTLGTFFPRKKMFPYSKIFISFRGDPFRHGHGNMGCRDSKEGTHGCNMVASSNARYFLSKGHNT